MAQGLFLAQRMALSQVLAPQLQQSLQLLQAPNLELKALVQQELQQNPVLEEIQGMELGDPDRADREADAADPAEPPSDTRVDPTLDRSSGPVDDFQAQLERLSQMDAEWREHFSGANIPNRASVQDEEKRQFMFDSLTRGSSLQEDLVEQLRQSEIPEDEWPLAELIIGNIDDHGYLKASKEELVVSANGSATAAEVEETIQAVQQFFPVGVGARDLRECLMLQLARAGKTHTFEYKILDQHMDLLAKRRFPDIAKAMGLEVTQVQDAAARIAKLNPMPGREFAPETDQYVLPEVFVEEDGDGFAVTTNNDHLPSLRISNTYKDLMAQAKSSPEVREYIREKIRSGKFLIKSLHQRQQTILSIAKEIVRRQREFFQKGVAHLKPMTMAQVAEVVGVHETTVSRAVSGKYMETPQGLIEMKYFFTSGVTMADGTGMSSTSIKELVADMLKGEDRSKPLSDQEIVKMLDEKGINIARRTVAKYRSELGILPSNLRKEY